MAAMSEQSLGAARELQREMYGQPLGELVHQLTAQLRITQARLAAVLGVSAPMLSQLASGQRVKFGNPAVVGRLQALIDLAARAGTLTPDQLDDALTDIQGSTTTLTQPRRSALTDLRDVASGAELNEAAAALQQRWPRLAEVLREAAGG